MSFIDKLAEERRARLAAERTLQLRQSQLSDTARKLDRQKQAMTDEITQTRAQVADVQTENERVKLHLTEANQKVEVAERRLWDSIETIQDGFAVFDATDRLIMANKAYLTPFEGLEEVAPGITYSRIIDIMLEEGLVDPGDEMGDAFKARLIARWRKTRPESIVLRLFNGQFIKLIDRRSAEGDVASLALNITETVRYEERLKAEQKKSEAASRTKSAFLANMSHEIRTPMNGVVGMAELLLTSELNEEQKLYAETIRNSGEALLQIINDVLDYSKIEADKITLREEPFDLEYTLQEIAMLLQPRVREKGITLLVDYDMFLPTRYRGDRGRLRQILTNLMGNAVKFTETGHVIVRVVGVPEKDSKVSLRIAVEDTGVGIPKDKLEHVFGEFNQVESDRNRAFEGTGLGLSISQRLARMMGGDIWVTSVPRVGSCFGMTLTLPSEEAVSYDFPQVPANVTSVLIADPKVVARTVLARQLRAVGLTVVEIATSADITKHTDIDAAVISSDIDPQQGAATASALRAAGSKADIIRLLDGLEAHAIDDSITVPLPVSRRHLLAALGNVQPAPSPLKPSAIAKEELDVLLAEDNKTNRLVFSKLVATMPLKLRVATNGLEAVQEVQKQRPDLIFMDISMPHMDGKEATRAIRRDHDPNGDLPIIAVTAHAMKGDREQILEAGLTDYMTKPVRRANVVSVLNQHFPDLKVQAG